MILELDVVELNVPLLLGLDVLHKYKLVIDNVDDSLVCKRPAMELPIYTKTLSSVLHVGRSIMYSEM